MALVSIEAPIRAAVFLEIISRYSSTVTSVRRSKLMSRYCPSHSATTSSPSRRTAEAAHGGAERASTSLAAASIASPARIAGPAPNTAHAVNRFRRVRSSSITSSCSNEKLCTNSTATPAGTASRSCSLRPPTA